MISQSFSLLVSRTMTRVLYLARFGVGLFAWTFIEYTIRHSG